MKSQHSEQQSQSIQQLQQSIHSEGADWLQKLREVKSESSNPTVKRLINKALTDLESGLGYVDRALVLENVEMTGGNGGTFENQQQYQPQNRKQQLQTS